MSLKKREFRNLHQGNRSVGDYVEELSKLSRYAPGDAVDDAAKQEKFLEGLNDDLGLQLTVATFNNYQELVDKALILEGKQQQVENRKRKYGQGKYNSGVQQKPRYTPYSGNNGLGSGKYSGHTHHSHGGHSHHGGNGHNHNGHRNGNGNGRNNNQHQSNPATSAKKDLRHITYFKCGKTEHYTTER